MELHHPVMNTLWVHRDRTKIRRTFYRVTEDVPEEEEEEEEEEASVKISLY